MRTSKTTAKIKEVAGVIFALTFVLCGVMLWAFLMVGKWDDCTSRGHSFGWCMFAGTLDTGR